MGRGTPRIPATEGRALSDSEGHPVVSGIALEPGGCFDLGHGVVVGEVDGDRVEAAQSVFQGAALVGQSVVGAEQRQDGACRRAVELDQEGVEFSDEIGSETVRRRSGHATALPP